MSPRLKSAACSLLLGTKRKHSLADSAKPMGKMTPLKAGKSKKRQRHMGVEPTEDRAERPSAVLKTVRPTGPLHLHIFPYAVFCHVSSLLSSQSMPLAERLKSPPHDDHKGSPLLYTAGTTSMRRSIVVTTLAVVMPRGARQPSFLTSCGLVSRPMPLVYSTIVSMVETLYLPQ